MPRDLQARGLSPSEVCRFVYHGELGVKCSLSRQLLGLSQSHGTDWVRRRRVVQSVFRVSVVTAMRREVKKSLGKQVKTRPLG